MRTAEKAAGPVPHSAVQQCYSCTHCTKPRHHGGSGSRVTCPLSHATALASIVLPVPGGPNSSRPAEARTAWRQACVQHEAVRSLQVGACGFAHLRAVSRAVGHC